jgi:hypothetical protein
VPNPGCLFIGHGPKTFPVTWLTGNQIIHYFFSLKIHLIRRKVTWITYNPRYCRSMILEKDIEISYDPSDDAMVVKMYHFDVGMDERSDLFAEFKHY